MPLPTPPKEVRPRHPRPVEEEFVVFLQGIPPHCRWQELKDLVRQTALHIRQAVVYDDSHGHPTGIGQIIIKNEDEAWRTYNRLSTNGWNGLSLTVTLARASAPTKPIAGPTKSPPANRAPYVPGYSPSPLVTSIVTSPPVCSVSPDSPMSPTFTQTPDFGGFFNPINNVCSPNLVTVPPEPLNYTSHYSFPANNTLPLPSCYFFNPIPDQHTPMQSRRYQQAPGQTSPDRHRSSGSGGSGMTSPVSAPPSRNIFIQFLSQDTTSKQLKEYLGGFGTVERCEVQERKPIHGRQPRIYATATFQTTDEAKQAIARLDNSIFRGARIRVRFDRDFGGSGGNGGIGTGRTVDTSATVRESPAKMVTSENTKTPSKGPITPTGPRSMTKEGRTGVSQKNGEPLVVNGSCVGLKTGRSNLDMFRHEDELTQKTQEISL